MIIMNNVRTYTREQIDNIHHLRIVRDDKIVKVKCYGGYTTRYPSGAITLLKVWSTKGNCMTYVRADQCEIAD